MYYIYNQCIVTNKATLFTEKNQLFYSWDFRSILHEMEIIKIKMQICEGKEVKGVDEWGKQTSPDDTVRRKSKDYSLCSFLES